MNEEADSTVKLRQELSQLDSALEVVTDLLQEVELLREEEPREAATEALDNVITLLQARVSEYHKRRRALVYQLRETGFFVEF